MRPAPTTLLTIVACMLALAGCGGSDDSGSKDAGGDDGGGAKAPGLERTELRPNEYEDQEYASLEPDQLQPCPADSNEWIVAHEGHTALAHCGTATATATLEGKTVELERGWCNVTDERVELRFGGFVEYDEQLDGDLAALRELDTIEVSLGPGDPDYAPVTKDGTYTVPARNDHGDSGEGDEYGTGILVAVNTGGVRWLNDVYEHESTVVLEDGRTRGSFEVTDQESGAPLVGEFECGDAVFDDPDYVIGGVRS